MGGMGSGGLCALLDKMDSLKSKVNLLSLVPSASYTSSSLEHYNNLLSNFEHENIKS